MKLELVVVFFPPNLAISPALNRVSKIEAVMMSHDPAKNNSGRLRGSFPARLAGGQGSGEPAPGGQPGAQLPKTPPAHRRSLLPRNTAAA